MLAVWLRVRPTPGPAWVPSSTRCVPGGSGPAPPAGPPPAGPAPAGAAAGAPALGAARFCARASSGKPNAAPAAASSIALARTRRRLMAERRVLLMARSSVVISPRMEQQLLRAPVQELGDVELVLRRAGELVNPAELLERLARAAEPALHLAVERELVDTARIRVRDVQHLVRRRGDAERPRRARPLRLRSAARLRRPGPDRDGRVRRHRHVDRERAQQLARGVEHLDAAVAAVGDVHAILRVDRDRVQRVELARSRT